MRGLNSIIFEYGTYFVAYLGGYIASLAGLPYLAGALLIGEAVFLYIHWYKESGSLVELRALFTLAWVGGQGIACLKLSNLQMEWSHITWLCFLLVYLGFGVGYEWKKTYKAERDIIVLEDDLHYSKKIFICICGLMAVSIICFLIEAVRVGFIPLFSDEPHAYSYFHLSGVHYFTISCILIPAITVLYLKLIEGNSLKWIRKIVLLLANATAVLIPVLCVSRFQLLFAVGFAVVTYIAVNKKIRLKTVIILLCVLVPSYVLLTAARNHDVAYLNGIFDMKRADMPIFITQPYIYVANNFENFNCMVMQLTEHTLGLKMLFPVFALTGLKFVFPELTTMPMFLTKPELTTLTMFYDSYYDFGVIGVVVLAVVVGIMAKVMSNWIKKSPNPVSLLLYGQMAIYLGLAFFTTWFSNPTTWFWFALTGMMYWFVGHKRNEKGQESNE